MKELQIADKELFEQAQYILLNMELRKYTTQLDKLNAEIADSLTGDSVYSPEQLSAAITGINQNKALTYL